MKNSVVFSLFDLPQPAAHSMVEMSAGSAGSADYEGDILEVGPVSLETPGQQRGGRNTQEFRR